MIYQISTEQGPIECEVGAAKYLELLKRFHKITVIDFVEGEKPGTYKMVKFSSSDDLSEYVGSIEWVWEGSYDPAHKDEHTLNDFGGYPLKFSVCQDE